MLTSRARTALLMALAALDTSGGNAAGGPEDTWDFTSPLLGQHWSSGTSQHFSSWGRGTEETPDRDRDFLGTRSGWGKMGSWRTKARRKELGRDTQAELAGRQEWGGWLQEASGCDLGSQGASPAAPTVEPPGPGSGLGPPAGS